jgi:hypothetical protein
MKTTHTYHGANITYYWDGEENDPRSAYVSFELPPAELMDDVDFDMSDWVTPSGVPDDSIFYYFNSKEHLVTEMAGDEFTVVSIDEFHESKVTA